MAPLFAFPVLLVLAQYPETPLAVWCAVLLPTAFGVGALMSWGEGKKRPLLEGATKLLATGKAAAVVFAPYGVLTLTLQLAGDSFLSRIQRFFAEPLTPKVVPIVVILNLVAILCLGVLLAKLARLRLANGQWLAAFFATASLLRTIGLAIPPSDSMLLTAICCTLTFAGLCLLSPVVFARIVRATRDFPRATHADG